MLVTVVSKTKEIKTESMDNLNNRSKWLGHLRIYSLNRDLTNLLQNNLVTLAPVSIRNLIRAYWPGTWTEPVLIIANIIVSARRGF